ncbi:hypothetical protein LTS15_005031 [Exophiala xenobiotica]|nr:hypothetical protein LTS15_005031 [Exophiala xenobiotica]
MKTDLTVTTIEVQMECQGISCWDFAYPTGKCSLPSKKDCPFTRSGSKSRKSKSKDQSRPESSNATFSFRNKAKHESQTIDARTFLVSCPNPPSVINPHTFTTISALLLQPRTQLVLLVPQKHIVCSRVCEISRLPRSGGSGIQVLPVPEVVAMTYTTTSAETGGDSDNDDNNVNTVEKANVAELVRKIVKYTKTKNFDGYLVFQEDRASWQFLERVGKGVMAAAGKAESRK